MNYVGLDVHKHFTYGVIKNEKGDELNRSRFDNSRMNFNSFLRGFKPEETLIVMESTGVWEFLYDLLDSKGYKVKLANPVKTKAIAYARVKTDAVDASTLADLLRANLIAESYVPSKEIRKLRDVTRQRKTLVKGQTQVKNKIHAMLTKHGMNFPYATLCDKAMQWIIDEIKDTSIKTILVSYINLLAQYKHELKLIDEKINDIAEKDEKAKLLMTIPGVGGIRAMEIIAEAGDFSRFPSADKFSSYSGLVPSIRQSGSTLKVGRLIQQASKHLKYVFIETAWVAVRKDNSLKHCYQKLSKKKGKQKAICAVARRICCIAYAMMRDNREFIVL